VSAEAGQALASVGIKTVFDLGASSLFRMAARDPALTHESTETGQRAGTTGAVALRDALHFKTIGDLATWPAYVLARALVGELTGSVAPTADPAESFRPRFGEYPTECVYYNTLVMLQVEPSAAPHRPLQGPIPVDRALREADGPQSLAVGAALTYSQSWYAQGITLGQLLHSLALAPGEATRIAVVDWSRQSSSTDTKSTSQEEQLANKLGQNRALKEIAGGTMEGLEEGGSTAHATAKTKAFSKQSSMGSGLIESPIINADGSITNQSGESTTDASSKAWSAGKRHLNAEMNQFINDQTEQHSSSARSRWASAVSEISQSEHSTASTRVVANYNHMHALTVQYYEIVQAYRIATELRRAERCVYVPLGAVDFSKPDAEHLIERFRGPLARGALSMRARELLSDQTSAVAIIPSLHVRVPTAREHAARAWSARREATRSPRTTSEAVAGAVEHAGHREHSGSREHEKADELHHERRGGLHDVLFEGPAKSSEHQAARAELLDSLLRSATGGPGHGPERAAAGARLDFLLGGPVAQHPAVRDGWWDLEEVAPMARLLGAQVFRPGSNAVHLPSGTELVGVSFAGVAIASVTVHGGSHPAENLHGLPEQGAELELPSPQPLAELDGISVVKREDHPVSGLMRLICTHLGRQFTTPAIPVALPTGRAPHQVARFRNDNADRRKELIAHLQGNRAHYSQIIHRALDPAAVLAMLAPYTWNGKPLADQVEPTPLSVSGGYMVLRAPVEAHELSGMSDAGRQLTWSEVLETRGLTFGDRDERVVATPTSGVYAEAVLGVSNSAEELDMTRFWNWQDSPIPLTPTELVPPSTESRATMEDAKPAGLESPVLGLMTPSALPTPGAVGAAMSALSNANAFRDMSGLAGTQALASSALTQATTAADTAGQLASANMATEAQKAVAMGETTANLIKSLAGEGASGGGSGATSGKGSAGKNISTTGAMTNKAKEMDQRGVPVPQVGGSTAAGGASAGGAEAKTVAVPPEETWEANVFSQAATGVSPGIMNAAYQLGQGGSPFTLAAWPPPQGPGFYPGSPQPLPIDTEAAAARAVSFAYFQLTHPYGHDNHPNAWDCSSLTQAAYDNAGITIPATADPQFHFGPQVPADDELEVGDLAFFGHGTTASHVGIVVRLGTSGVPWSTKMIHAPGKGRFVEETHFEPTIGEAFGSLQYIGATRPAAGIDTAQA